MVSPFDEVWERLVSLAFLDRQFLNSQRSGQLFAYAIENNNPILEALTSSQHRGFPQSNTGNAHRAKPRT
jgi:hypothetical protein